jgi:hypothetical protein
MPGDAGPYGQTVQMDPFHGNRHRFDIPVPSNHLQSGFNPEQQNGWSRQIGNNEKGLAEKTGNPFSFLVPAEGLARLAPRHPSWGHGILRCSGRGKISLYGVVRSCLCSGGPVV